MRVIDVCSGIGTTAVAWHSLGWEHLCFAEIEKFPSAVLKHRWPGIVNEGDFTKIGDKYRGAADLLVGGTPCQSFSVAGLRGGLADDRGNLALEFLRLVGRTWPRWVVWENVPGVHSSWSDEAAFAAAEAATAQDIEEARRAGEILGLDLGAAFSHSNFEEIDQTSDFDCFLSGLEQLGYGVATRVLDAQHFGLPQRRRRVFVVGCLGDWRAAAAVLFERHSLQRDHPPRREKGQGFTHDVAPCIGASGRGFERTGDTRGQDAVVSCPLTRNPYGDHESRESLLVTHSLRADGFDASEDGAGRGTPIVPIAFNHKASAHQSMNPGEVSPTLEVGKSDGVCVFGETGQGYWQEGIPPLRAEGDSRPSRPDHVVNQDGMAVRRLTPRECERLQGLPDDHTLVPYNGKPASDGPRYKAIGNGMAVPVVKWIGERIQAVESSLKK